MTGPSGEWLYDQESAISATSSGTWSTSVAAAWNIGMNPNGGYAMASCLRAMRQLVIEADGMNESISADPEPAAKLDPLTVTTHFLRPSLGGQAGEVKADLVRSGRRLSTATASLTQGGKERLRVIAAFGRLDDHDGDDDDDGTPAPGQSSTHAAWDIAPELTIEPVQLPDPEDCRDRRQLEQGVELPILSRLDVRIDPELAEPGAGGRAEVAGWIRFGDGRPVDTMGLVLFADAFPPSLYSLLGRVGWVPTIELTVQVRRRPKPGWIRARLRTSDLTDGMLVEDGELWDIEGNLVARTRQLALLLPPD